MTSSIGVQAGVVVVAQAARLVVDHLSRASAAGPTTDKILSTCSWSSTAAKRTSACASTIGQFVGDRVGIDRHRNGAEHLRRHHRPIELRPVGADDGDGVAALDAEPMQPDRIGAHALEHLGPGPGLPDAEILVPHGRPAAEHLRRCGSIASETYPPCAAAVDRHGAHPPNWLRLTGHGAAPLAAFTGGLVVVDMKTPPTARSSLPAGLGKRSQARSAKLFGGLEQRRSARRETARAAPLLRPWRRRDGAA